MAANIVSWICTIVLAFAVLLVYEMVEELVRHWLKATRLKSLLHSSRVAGPSAILLSTPNSPTVVGMAVIYRRKRNGDTWHFSSDCSEWPSSNYDEQEPPPLTGALCNECKVNRHEKKSA